MITDAFINKAMQVVLTSGKSFYLGASPTAVITDLGKRTITFSTDTTSEPHSVIVKTTSEVYFEQAIGKSYTVSCINACSTAGDTNTPYYSMPLQKTTTIQDGYQIKVNKYATDALNGEHIRGIMIKFSIPE